MVFRAGIGAELSGAFGREGFPRFQLRHSVDAYSSRLRVDDLRYLEERPRLYDDFDYVIYNEDFFYERAAAVAAASSGAGVQCSSAGGISTRSCSDLECHTSLSAAHLSSDGGGGYCGDEPAEELQLTAQRRSRVDGWHLSAPLLVAAGGPLTSHMALLCTETAAENAAGHEDLLSSSSSRTLYSERGYVGNGGGLPHHGSREAIRLEVFLNQKFGDRHGYYPRIGLHSYIPRREFANGILDVLYELAMNMSTFVSGTVGKAMVLDLTNAVFSVHSMSELAYIDAALASYSRWIAETQTHHSNPQIPFANDTIQYCLLATRSPGDYRIASMAPSAASASWGASTAPSSHSASISNAPDDDDCSVASGTEPDIDGSDGDSSSDGEGDSLLLCWMDYLVKLRPSDQMYLFALKQLLFAS